MKVVIAETVASFAKVSNVLGREQMNETMAMIAENTMVQVPLVPGR